MSQSPIVRTQAFFLLLLLLVSLPGSALAEDSPGSKIPDGPWDRALERLEFEIRNLSLRAQGTRTGSSRPRARLETYLQALETHALRQGPDAEDVLQRIRGLQAALREAHPEPEAPTAASQVSAPARRPDLPPLPFSLRFDASNDDCANALPISDGSLSGTVLEATQDGLASCSPFGAREDVWFRYSPTTDGPVAMSLRNAFGEQSVSVHTSCPGTSLNQLACSSSRGSILEARVGTEYLVRVAGNVELGRQDFQLDIGPAGMISGAVTDRVSGEPVADARVELFEDFSTIAVATTEADGSYRIPVVLPGTYFIQTRADEYAESIYDDFECNDNFCSPDLGTPIEVAAGEETPGIDVALDRLGRISGRITDSVTGEPIPFEPVRFVRQGFSPQSFARTDENGVYEARDLAPGDWIVFTDGDLYRPEVHDDVPCQGPCTMSGGSPISLQLNQHVQDIDFALDSLGRISGTLTRAADGAPAPFEWVDVYFESGFQANSTVSDANGEYMIGGLETDTYFVVAASFSPELVSQVYQGIECIDCDPTTGAPVLVRELETTEPIDFSLERLGAISGRVTDSATGQGLGNAGLVIQSQAPPFLAEETLTDVEGNFQFSNLLPGGYQLSASAIGYRSEVFDNLPCTTPFCPLSEGTVIPVTTANTTSGIDLALDRLGQIRGTVRESASGRPVSEGEIIVFDAEANRITSGEIDTQGFFQLLDVPPGAHQLVATSPSHLAEVYREVPCSGTQISSCDLQAGEPLTVELFDEIAGIDFTLERLASITGIVRSAEGDTLRNAFIEAFSATGEFFETVSRPDGSYTVPGLREGTYFLVARLSSQGYLSTLYDGRPCEIDACDPTTGTPIVISGKEEVTIDLTLDRLGTISGTVREDFWGNGVEAARVQLFDSNGDSVTSGQTGFDGRYSISGLSPGTYFARASASNYFLEVFGDGSCTDSICDPSRGLPITVDINVETTDVDFELDVPQGIAGRVTDAATGLPIAGLEIEIHPEFGISETTETRSDGSYVLPLPIGRYFLRTRIGFHPYDGEDQFYDGITCTLSFCDPRDGTPVDVEGDQIVRDIDFALEGQFCRPSSLSLCLNQGRFRALTFFSDFSGGFGTARAEQLTADSGTFTFFDPDNVEMVVKVLDACGSDFDSFWVFAAGLTNLSVDVQVTDTVAGQTRVYSNALGNPFQLVRDTAAFATCNLGSETMSGVEGHPERIALSLEKQLLRLRTEASGEGAFTKEPRLEEGSETCTPSETALCLQQGRFRVEAVWTDTDGATDSARVVQLTPDTGYFWFFDPDNVEVITKALDACGSDFNSFWIFAAGLTDVGVVLRVTDTVSGQVEEYENLLGEGFVPIQDTGSFQTCP